MILKNVGLMQKGLKDGGGQVCQLCGRGVGTTVAGELIVVCHVCGFPVCRPCYEYERNAGSQSCPQCKTEYKRHKGLGDGYLKFFTVIHIIFYWNVAFLLALLEKP